MTRTQVARTTGSDCLVAWRLGLAWNGHGSGSRPTRKRCQLRGCHCELGRAWMAAERRLGAAARPPPASEGRPG